MTCYIDSSVVLRFLLTQDPAFNQTSQYNVVGASELLIIECQRVLDRYRLEDQISDIQLAEVKHNFHKIADGLHIIELSQSIKDRAADSFPTIIGTLDALHLATLICWQESSPRENFVLLSVDQQMRTCATALGISLIG